MLRDAVVHCKKYLEKIPSLQWHWSKMEYKAAGLHKGAAEHWIVTQGLITSRSSVQNQHIYCMINVRLQKICKNKVCGLENNAVSCLFWENDLKDHFILQFEKMFWFDRVWHSVYKLNILVYD